MGRRIAEKVTARIEFPDGGDDWIDRFKINLRGPKNEAKTCWARTIFRKKDGNGVPKGLGRPAKDQYHTKSQLPLVVHPGQNLASEIQTRVCTKTNDSPFLVCMCAFSCCAFALFLFSFRRGG